MLKKKWTYLSCVPSTRPATRTYVIALITKRYKNDQVLDMYTLNIYVEYNNPVHLYQHVVVRVRQHYIAVTNSKRDEVK